MKRRKFLKVLGLTPLMAVLPVAASDYPNGKMLDSVYPFMAEAVEVKNQEKYRNRVNVSNAKLYVTTKEGIEHEFNLASWELPDVKV